MMARKVDAMPPGERGRRNAKYPWDEWLDGEAWELVRGEDFTTTPLLMRHMAYKVAYGRGLRVIGSIRGDRLYLQAHTNGTP